MAIPQAIAAASTLPRTVEKATSAERSDAVADGSAQSALPTFSSLLRGVQAQVQQEAAPQADALTEALTDVPSQLQPDPTGSDFSLDGLLGQTRQLDLPRSELELHEINAQAAQHAVFAPPQGTQPHVAAGQLVATVAAGVQAAPDGTAAAERAAGAVAASAVLVQAADAAKDAVAEASEQAAAPGSGSEGRVALDGTWRLADEQTQDAPAMQRILAQVQQWVVASTGTRPGERKEVAAAGPGSGLEIVRGDAGSGMRLTDAAVSEVQQAQDAMLEAQHEAPVEDMRLWLLGRQQRAEVTLEHDGQPVRVQVSVRGSEAHVILSAAQAQTRDMLDAHEQQLRQMLQAQGLELAGLVVQDESQGQNAGQQERGARSPWQPEAAQHAQIRVPQAQGQDLPAANGRGLDVYV